jgi:hypothetical protein
LGRGKSKKTVRTLMERAVYRELAPTMLVAGVAGNHRFIGWRCGDWKFLKLFCPIDTGRVAVLTLLGVFLTIRWRWQKARRPLVTTTGFEGRSVHTSVICWS